MFTFSQPGFLLLFPVAGLLLWRWWKRRQPAVRYSDTSLMSELPSGRARLARIAGIGFRSAALLFLILALSGLRWPDRGSRIASEGIAIEFVVDASGSMATPDFNWQGQVISRLEAVKKAFRLFVDGGDAEAKRAEVRQHPGADAPRLAARPAQEVHFEGRPNDLIGLTTFARWPKTACPLTLSHSVLLRQMGAEKPRTIPTESETNIGDAVAWGLIRLEKAKPKRRVMILLSDGEHNVPPPALTPRQAAQLAANLGVSIYTIDAGSSIENRGSRIEEGQSRTGDAGKEAAEKIRASAEKTMETIAQITGGRHFKVQDTDSLLQVCREIDRMETQEIASFQYRRYFEGYPMLGLISFSFLGLVGLLELSVFRRIP
jgi:Ca-activated chloride channel family protein